MRDLRQDGGKSVSYNCCHLSQVCPGKLAYIQTLLLEDRLCTAEHQPTTTLVLYIPCIYIFTIHFTELFWIIFKCQKYFGKQQGKGLQLRIGFNFSAQIHLSCLASKCGCACVSVCDHLVNFVASHLPAVSVAPSVPTAQ